MVKESKSVYITEKAFPVGHVFISGFSGTIIPDTPAYHSKFIKDAIDFKKRQNSHYEVERKMYLLYVTDKTVTKVEKVV